MLVTCENCKSKFNLDDNLVKESGSKVRCSNCKNVFTVYRPVPVEAVSEDFGLEEQAGVPETSDELAEEPLDFDLFESEEEQDDGELSLEDFGLEEELTNDSEASEDAEKQVVAAEEEITAEELGFGAEQVAEQAAEPVQEVVSQDSELEGLDLEEPSTKVALPSEDDAVKEDSKAEDEISFDDLALEEDSVLKDAVVSDDQEAREEAEEAISFDDLDLEEEAVLEETVDADESFLEEQVDGDSLDFDDVNLEDEVSDGDLTEHVAGAKQSEDMETPIQGVVASLDDGEEREEVALDDIPPAAMIQEAPAKKGISMPLLICLVVVLLGGGAYTALTFLKGDGMKLPFLESLAGPGQMEPVDSGNLHISLLDNGITGGFVENKMVGRLFVVKGKIKSSYPEARNFIRMKGVLYFRDGKVAKDGIVYCGNVLSEAELQTLGMDAIKKRLSNRFGDNKSNFRVPSGKELPFMVVFNELPEDLGEFSVEVVDSVPG